MAGAEERSVWQDPPRPHGEGRLPHRPLPSIVHVPGRYFAAIGFVGGIYPVLVAIVVALATWHVDVGFGAAMLVVVVAILSAFLALWLSVPALLVGTLIYSTLRLPTDIVRYLAFSSGLLGLVALGPLLLVGEASPSGDMWQRGMTYFALGPALITPLMQLAGGWSEWESSGGLPPKVPWRFGIRQVLLATLWLALLLTFLKLFGMLTLWVAVWVTGWFVYQAGSMWLVLKFLSWRGVLKGGGGDGGGMRG